MIRIFVDFEMNKIYKKDPARNKLHSEIIQIGAVKMNDRYQVIDRFSLLVKPEHHSIVVKNVYELTGISMADLKDAPLLADAMLQFMDWVGSEEHVKWYAWSDSDRSQLVRECTFKGIWDDRCKKTFRRWVDFQRVFSRLIGLHQVISLDRALGCVEEQVEGKRHDACFDAENCARLMELAFDREEFLRRTEYLKIIVREPVRETFTIGSGAMGSKLDALLAQLKEAEKQAVHS